MKADEKGSVAHLGFTQTYSTSPRPADDLGWAVMVRLGLSQRSQRESELGWSVQMRPETKLLSVKLKFHRVCACNKTSPGTEAWAMKRITKDETQQHNNVYSYTDSFCPNKDLPELVLVTLRFDCLRSRSTWFIKHSITFDRKKTIILLFIHSNNIHILQGYSKNPACPEKNKVY